MWEKNPSSYRAKQRDNISGALQLIPSGAAHAVLADDYARMLADGMLLDDSESFDRLMDRCALIEVRANETKG